MNPYSGEMEHFDSILPQGWLKLTPEEEAELTPLSSDARLTRYMTLHGDDLCGGCGDLIRIHSLHRFKICAADQFALLDAKRHEQDMKQFFDSIPKREPLNAFDLRERMRAEQAKVLAGK
jgi:hypothetical protein